MIKRNFVVAAALIFMFASCGTSSNTGSETTEPPVNFEGSYVATALTQNGAAITIVENTTIALALESDSLSITTGCNQASGSYSLVDAKLATADLAQTLASCEQPVMAQEELIVKVVSSAPAIDLQSDALTLASGEDVITFVREVSEEPPVLETKWVATGFIQDDTASTLPIDEPGHVTFISGDSGVVLKGFDGCLLAEGAATISDGTLGGPKETKADGQIIFDTITSKPPSEDHVACSYDQRRYSGKFTGLFDAEKVDFTVEAGTLTLVAENGFGLTFTTES